MGRRASTTQTKQAAQSGSAEVDNTTVTGSRTAALGSRSKTAALGSRTGVAVRIFAEDAQTKLPQTLLPTGAIP